MTSNKELAFLILAAGKGTRMKNDLPKVMHKIAGKSMIEHVMDVAGSFNSKYILPIISPSMPLVEGLLNSKYPKSKIIYQTEQLGTGHAVKICLEALKDFKGVVVALYGDTPLIRTETIARMLEEMDEETAVSVLGFETEQPNAYGRIICSSGNKISEIVEFKEANEIQKQCRLCNSGVMAFSGQYLADMINKIDNNNSKSEYYLTDAIKIANNMGKMAKVIITDENEVIGVNSQEERAEAEKLLQKSLRKKHMENGVILIDPKTVHFSTDTKIAPGVTIEPFVIFKGKVSIAAGCEIKSFSHLEDCVIEAGAAIGPYSRIRPGTEIGEKAKVGNFVEVKKTKLGKGSKINHLSYVGDSVVGNDVNIGAGTITCNYDGKNKHITEIGDGAFIGSNTTIVAPVKIGKNALIGAATTILKDAPENKLTITEKSQKSIERKNN